MNQILRSSFKETPPPISPSFKTPAPKVSVFFKYQFYLSTSLAILAILFLAILFYTKSQKEMYSQQLLQTYQIATLYATGSATSTPMKVPEDTSFIIGAIRIDKIRVHYPILSSFSEENLQIAPCRISGPLPNEIGNLCIAGHNYVDTKFFSRLHELSLQDTILIYDLKGNSVLYEVYDKYEVAPDDLSCLDISSENNRELTLITCNNVTGNRLVLKAIEQKRETKKDT